MDQKTSIKIGYVSNFNPFQDKKAWSGSIYKLREAIECAGFDVVWIPYRTETLLVRILLFFLRLKLKGNIVGYLYNKWFFYLVSKTIDVSCEEYQQCTHLFFPGGAQIAKFLKTDKKIIYCSDTTFHAMLNYYWFDVHPWVIRNGDACEYEGVHSASINIRTSQWAADSLLNHYLVDPDKVFVLPLGPTVDVKDLVPVESYSSGKIRVLFSGVEWERKGGGIAVEVVDLLNAMGIESQLIMVGIRELPDAYKNNPYIEHIGFLDKNNSAEYKRYIETLRSCHMLLLPTQAECAGIVFSEASALGLPIFTYDTGGVGDYVVNGVNGFRLPLGAEPSVFAEKIAEVIKSNQMKQLHDNALDFYQRRLAWSNWSADFKNIISNFA